MISQLFNSFVFFYRIDYAEKSFCVKIWYLFVITKHISQVVSKTHLSKVWSLKDIHFSLFTTCNASHQSLSKYCCYWIVTRENIFGNNSRRQHCYALLCTLLSSLLLFFSFFNDVKKSCVYIYIKSVMFLIVSHCCQKRKMLQTMKIIWETLFVCEKWEWKIKIKMILPIVCCSTMVVIERSYTIKREKGETEELMKKLQGLQFIIIIANSLLRNKKAASGSLKWVLQRYWRVFLFWSLYIF